MTRIGLVGLLSTVTVPSRPLLLALGEARRVEQRAVRTGPRVRLVADLQVRRLGVP